MNLINIFIIYFILIQVLKYILLYIYYENKYNEVNIIKYN